MRYAARQPLGPFTNASERKLIIPLNKNRQQDFRNCLCRSLVVGLDERQRVLGAVKCNVLVSKHDPEYHDPMTYSSPGLTPTFFSMSFPVPFSKMKCERLMLKREQQSVIDA